MIARPPLVVPLAALAGFVVLMALVVADWAPIERFDLSLSGDFRTYGASNPDLISFVRTATDVAATLPFLAYGAAATLYFAVTRQRASAVFCALVTAAIPLLWGIMHWALHRPRPLDGFVFVDSNGFPSGHTSHAAAAGLAAVLLLWHRLGRLARTVVLSAALVFALLVGATRVVLLAHWPTDVLGAYLLALAVVPLLARTIPRHPAP
ncbi:phosphatase PAP2 family protein [Phytohabitans aurantiacus]|uniref:Membrane protein n=1 Tax=Phytohabitans aurantiacus TaxID=3016789 RepID=A0ABQ5QYR7_9ACTN|nr:phosphatase PAP2 family protein [Phytohabitans aurantiacus]GLH99076.1 membrane protein [Phytohabitans aurantiacus]